MELSLHPKSGVVKWFDPKKGFGFITSDEVDYFIHYINIEKEGFKKLQRGQSVLFNITENNKAINVKYANTSE